MLRPWQCCFSRGTSRAHFLPSFEGAQLSNPFWKQRAVLLTCGARFLLLPLPRRRLPKLWRGRTCLNITAWRLQKSSSASLVHSALLLSDHVHFLLCVSCLGSSSDTQALDTRRGWCFIFPPCSSAILFFCFLFDKGTC